MKRTDDLNWLGALAFVLIVGLIAFSVTKETRRNLREKIKTETATNFR